MKIIKKYHFYAAHRNKDAGEKCRRIHGHTYDMVVHLAFNKFNDITMLFSEIDSKMDKIIKKYDHYFLLWEKDELCEVLDVIGEEYVKLPFQTSIENLTMWIFKEIKIELGLPIVKLELAETKSSNCEYEENT